MMSPTTSFARLAVRCSVMNATMTSSVLTKLARASLATIWRKTQGTALSGMNHFTKLLLRRGAEGRNYTRRSIAC